MSIPECSSNIGQCILTFSPDSVLAALRGFPKASSPGASQLQCQHLLDAIDGNTSPSAKDCLDRLTRLLRFLLSGMADVRIAPWLCGAPLTALLKKPSTYQSSLLFSSESCLTRCFPSLWSSRSWYSWRINWKLLFIPCLLSLICMGLILIYVA